MLLLNLIGQWLKFFYLFLLLDAGSKDKCGVMHNQDMKTVFNLGEGLIYLQASLGKLLAYLFRG
ncbi:uncharacterized protein ASCRUDRAFT_80268 [Ascoidea rubescens DSM 1968]|uniref:Uncharacterized protein n=1 Tax=Ascoidea rubescens DSM 1968 TaxID=1344418 RepID=A0A1D2VJZ9_9ASCO|nr:hypothetical protein ASCRUDRAFT_80268 [Ascoidea rubescens DSM 1968]ODV61918.1 hypothetical protein ASCRUDRAFT_80268 [Ascoidea rubescens DSM 1968]